MTIDGPGWKQNQGITSEVDLAAYLQVANAGKSYNSHVVKVDKGGNGDFTTVKAACDYVLATAQAAERWLIEVGPGYYPEEPFSVPEFTTIRGTSFTVYNWISSGTVLYFSDIGTTPAIILHTDSTLSNLAIEIPWDSTVNGNTTLIRIDMSDYGMAYINQCWLQCCHDSPTFDVKIIDCSDTANEAYLYISDTIFYVGGASDNTGLVGVDLQTKNQLAMWKSFMWGPSTGQGAAVKSGGGPISIFASRSAGWLNDIDNTNGTVSLNQFTYSGAISNSGGTISNIHRQALKTPSSKTDTGKTGQICWDADYIYVCVATNTWKRIAISDSGW